MRPDFGYHWGSEGDVGDKMPIPVIVVKPWSFPKKKKKNEPE